MQGSDFLRFLGNSVIEFGMEGVDLNQSCVWNPINKELYVNGKHMDRFNLQMALGSRNHYIINPILLKSSYFLDLGHFLSVL